jgi:hypothetical protein
MDFLLMKRIADSCLERRTAEIQTYVYGYLVDEKTPEELVAGLNRIRSEEKARVLAEDALHAKQSAPQVSEVGEA